MSPDVVDGDADVLLLCDHASAHVPADIDLGIAPVLLERHIAVDIGAEALTRALAARLGAPAILGTVSRLVIDLHRQVDHPHLIPAISDGHVIPGNGLPDRGLRVARFHAPYHQAVAIRIRQNRPRLIVSVHSFTPALEAGGDPRPWEVGILYNRDTRAARLAIEHLSQAGIMTGDNQPYSGRLLNATLNRHGEGNGIPSLAVEVRNDLILTDAGVARWAEILAAMTGRLRNTLAPDGPERT